MIHSLTHAQRNALDWPLTDPAQQYEHRHSIGRPAALHHAYTRGGQPCGALLGGMRLILAVDASGTPDAEPVWQATVIVGESVEPLSEALPRRVWTRGHRRAAERLLGRVLSQVGVPASTVYDDGRPGAGRSPIGFSARKAMTPAEQRRVRRALRRNCTAWGRRWAALRAGGRAAWSWCVRSGRVASIVRAGARALDGLGRGLERHG